MHHRCWTCAKISAARLSALLVAEFEGRILPVDVAVALRCAKLHVPDPRPMRDALIAAAALVHRMTVVTRNVRDFEPMGVEALNPWEWTPSKAGATWFRRNSLLLGWNWYPCAVAVHSYLRHQQLKRRGLLRQSPPRLSARSTPWYAEPSVKLQISEPRIAMLIFRRHA